MKVTCKVMIIVALCAGFLQITEAANLKVKMVKLDPASRKKTWSYKIIPKKSTIISPRLKKFKEETTLSINPKDFESVLRVYTNSTGAGDAKELPLLQPVIDTLYKDHGISIDKDGNLNITPMNEIEKLVATGGSVKTRAISVVKTGDNRDEWRISSWNPATPANATVDTVTIKKGAAKATRRLDIPTDGNVVFMIDNRNKGINALPLDSLTIEKEQVEKLKVLKLNDEGKQAQ